MLPSNVFLNKLSRTYEMYQNELHIIEFSEQFFHNINDNF